MKGGFRELWHHYQDVVFQPLGPCPPWPSFAIITACNPASRVRTALVNRCAMAALIRRLRKHTYTQLRVCSSDLCYYEHSLATPVSLRSASCLAAQFDQLAIYYMQRGRLWLVPIARRQLPHRPIALKGAVISGNSG